MSEQETLLGDIRIIDLADQKGIYCTKLLADLGADTIKIEKPGGDPTRHIGPFFHDEPDPEKSLYWFQFNTSKRGITLNLETAAGREILKKLAKTADVIVETFPPGHLDEMGLGYSVLKETNSRLVLTSITPFGQTGPYRDYRASDLVAQAMGGLMYLAGYLEDPPHRLYGSQAYHSASVQAAVGTMMALYARELTGRGQHVDVSMQESVLMSQETAMQSYNLRQVIRRRISAEGQAVPGIGLYPCKDGYIWSNVIPGTGVGWDVIIDWMDSEGMADDLTDTKWEETFRLMGDLQALLALAADPEALEQVLINLLINAGQAVDKEDSWVRLRIKQGNSCRDHVVVLVSDNGCGMEEETRGKVFEPFFSTKTSGRGTGLGLFVSHNLIEELGGRIEVESELGKGSTFRIILTDMNNRA